MHLMHIIRHSKADVSGLSEFEMNYDNKNSLKEKLRK